MPALMPTESRRPRLEIVHQAAPEADERAGRMFPSLPAFASSTPAVQDALLDIARPGGLLDARQSNPHHPALPAGAALMAQFLHADAPFDLESMYHGGPSHSRNLYDP